MTNDKIERKYIFRVLQELKGLIITPQVADTDAKKVEVMV